MQGTIQTLLAVNDMLISGSNDQATGTIHMWKLDAAGQYQPQARTPLGARSCIPPGPRKSPAARQLCR